MERKKPDKKGISAALCILQNSGLVICPSDTVYGLLVDAKNEKAVKISVTTGQQFDSYIEVKSGLANGDQVIDNVSDKIKDGVKVKVI